VYEEEKTISKTHYSPGAYRATAITTRIQPNETRENNGRKTTTTNNKNNKLDSGKYSR